MGDFLPQSPRFTLEMFHAFRDERPKEEKWELIDGVPVMMPPPSLVHQRISRNIGNLLNERLRLVQPNWSADFEIGVLLPKDEKFNPEPDVTVIDMAIEIGQIYAERFYFVAEVLSSSDRPEQRAGSDRPVVLAAKLGYYSRHEHCRGVLIVHQDRIEAELYSRSANWTSVTLSRPADRIVIDDIGDIGRLGDLYRHTPLLQAGH